MDAMAGILKDFSGAVSTSCAQQRRAQGASCEVAGDAQSAEAHCIQAQGTEGIVYLVNRL
ncbi:MAG TPA: hypothetical protein VNZ02_15400 [Steroidobacteraceae bacterium]|jgi:hypothetical protein|nr:hypothetical protein [Steroidobacteraceae bacterium]